MIGRRSEEVLNRAVRFAFERKHEYFTLEHVLLSLLEETDILDLLQDLGASYTEMKKALEGYLEQNVPKNKNLKPGKEKNIQREKPDELEGELEKDDHEDEDSEFSDGGHEVLNHPVATLSIQRLIQRALFHVQSAGKDEIQPADLLVSLYQSKDSFALHLLKKQGLERLAVLNYLSHGRSEDEGVPSSDDGDGVGGKEKSSRPPYEEILEQYTANLNQLASAGKIDPLIGRESELERLIQTLGRRRKNNPLLVGEAGVGKTAIAEGLALRIIEKDVPPFLKDAEVYALDMGSLLAGAKFRGDFEQRFKKVLKAFEKKKEKGIKPILLIDEIHTIVGAGAVNGGMLDAANLLKPLLSRGEVQCIGSTTYNEYRSLFEKDHALSRRFQKIEVTEPGVEDTIKILNGLKSRFEEHHGVKYTADSIRAAVELSSKHITDRLLPDKAIDVIDEVGSRVRIQKGKKENQKVTITGEMVEEIISKIARIPSRSVNLSQKKRLKDLQRDLKLVIFGQEHAIDALVVAIRLARSGLRTGEKPVGSFLFCGPTGVGKTELSKQMAHSLGVPFLRFDMSEYMEKHTVSRLIGAPPGYVGFEQAGLLTEAALKNPHSVILLDEIEKAHSDIWNILLQIMDHGTLTDNNGKKADFRNVILIMTSNVGSREMERRPLGMGSDDATESVSKKEIERTFSPEFRNRLDAVVYFNPLDPVTIGQIVGKQLLELETQLLAKNVELEVDSDVREWLARKGYDRKMGARPMSRLIQDEMKKPLSEEILFGKLEFGGSVKVSLDSKKSGRLVFQYKGNPAPKKPQSSPNQIDSETASVGLKNPNEK